jgi:hypothetical protein
MKVFLPSRVKYQINGDFVENPQNQYKTCGKHHISCEYQKILSNKLQRSLMHFTCINWLDGFTSVQKCMTALRCLSYYKGKLPLSEFLVINDNAYRPMFSLSFI